MDANGVAFAVIQGLNEIVKEKEGQIEALHRQNAELEARLTALERAVGVSHTLTRSFASVLTRLSLGGMILLAGPLVGVQYAHKMS